MSRLTVKGQTIGFKTGLAICLGCPLDGRYSRNSVDASENNQKVKVFARYTTRTGNHFHVAEQNQGVKTQRKPRNAKLGLHALAP